MPAFLDFCTSVRLPLQVLLAIIQVLLAIIMVWVFPLLFRF